MKQEPNIAQIASMVGDRARADILTALMSGKALTATELAGVANITKQTASAHLSKLLDGNLVNVASQGRHKYFGLADDDVADLLESLIGIACRTGAVRVHTGPREPALRKARVCYNHLAGELGVLVYDSLKRQRCLRFENERLRLTKKGLAFFHEFGVDTEALFGQRREMCRNCLDWSMRRYHLAGSLGNALLHRMLELGWTTRRKGSRVLAFSQSGERALRKQFNAD